jgi:hypothetical protein
MTRSQALDEARRRWGPTGEILEVVDNIAHIEGISFSGMIASPHPDRNFEIMGSIGKSHCEVGIWIFGDRLSIRGSGETWEKAFEDADRRAVSA